MGNNTSTTQRAFCTVCSTRECKIFATLKDEYGLDSQGWTCRPGHRFEIGAKTKTVVMPKLVLLSDPGYEDWNQLSSLVDKTMRCNGDYRQCFLEGYFEVLAALDVEFFEYVSFNWWARTKIYLTRASRATLRIVKESLAIAAPAVLPQIGWYR